MLGQLYNKNKFLFRVALWSMLSFLLIGVIFVIDTIQKEQRNQEAMKFSSISKYEEQNQSYDVSGMTQEEINEMIIKIREEKLRGN